MQIKHQSGLFAIAVLGSVVVHASLFWWWRRRFYKSDKYVLLGKQLPTEQVETMQQEACDIDQVTEQPDSATKPSTLHPFYPLFIKPTQPTPGILPYKQKSNEISPISITEPLFSLTSKGLVPSDRKGHADRKEYEDEDDDGCSHASNASFAASSLLNIDDAYAQRADATWAPKPPKSPFEIPFRRTSANIAKTTTGIQRKMSIRDNASTCLVRALDQKKMPPGCVCTSCDISFCRVKTH